MRHLLAGVLLIPTSLAAQTTCGEHEAMKMALDTKYGEQVRMAAMSSDGQIVEFYGNEENGSWTILLMDSAGGACVVAIGHGFLFTEPGDLM